MPSPAAKHFAKLTGKDLPDDKPAPVPASDAGAPDEKQAAKPDGRVESPAKRHFQREQAKSEATPTGETYEDASQYELMLMQLAEHRRQLKAIQSVEAKVALKAKLLPEYLPYVEGVLEGKAGVQDDVLMTIMVWAVDVGDLALALRIGEYALANGLTTPDAYKRDTATLLAELYADEALADGDVDLDSLIGVCELTAEHDMPDEVRAKLHRAIGLALEETSLEGALWHLNRAIDLHDRVGAKGERTRVEKALKNRETGS